MIPKEEIKNKLSISDVLRHYGGECVNIKGGSWWCPIHETGGKSANHKTPSLVAKDDRGTATCLSQECFQADDIFGVIAKMEPLNIKSQFPEILQKACEIADIHYESQPHKAPLNKPIEELNEKHYNYLEDQGITGETIQLFELKARYDYILFPQIKNDSLAGYKGISIFKDPTTGKKKQFFEGEDTKCKIWYEPILKQQQIVIFVEGEKDCMRLNQELHIAGMDNNNVAVTGTAGAKSVPMGISEWFIQHGFERGLIIYDNDEPGLKGSNKIGSELLKTGKNIQILHFPNEYKQGYDVTDWFKEGHTLVDLLTLPATVPRPDVEPSKFFDNPEMYFNAATLRKEKAPPIEWMIKDFLACNTVGMVAATGSTGKTWFLMQLAVSIACGFPFMNMEIAKSGKVLIILGEEAKTDIHRRFEKIINFYRKEHRKNFLQMENLLDTNLYFLCVNGADVIFRNNIGLYPDLLKKINQDKPELLILDPTIRFFDGDENSSYHATRFIEMLETIKNLGITVLFSHHTSKSGAKGTDQHASRGSSAFVDGARWQIVLKKIRKDETNKFHFAHNQKKLDIKDIYKYIVAEISKCNGFMPIQNDFIFKKMEGGILIPTEELEMSDTGSD